MPDNNNTSGRGGQGDGADFVPRVIPIADARMRLELLEPKVAPPERNATKWPTPRPLPHGLLPVKPFDLVMLPAALVPWVEDIAERMQCPLDYPAVSAMAALGAAIGAKVGIRPKRHDDWLIVPNLWGCIIGPPGYMKSPAMNEVLKPLRRLEAEAKKGNKRAELIYAAELEEFKKSRKQKDSQSSTEPPEKATIRRYVVNDTSYEALGNILADNPNGVLAYRDELLALVCTLDREERHNDRGFFLQAWNGTDDYTFDRIIRGNIYVERACVSLFGSTQPGLITKYVHKVMAAGGGDGMLQRFQLLVWPDGSPNWKNVDRYPHADARASAHKIFARLDNMTKDDVGAMLDTYETIPFLRFDDAAQEMFDHWRAGLETRLRSGDLNPAIESHLAKYRKLVPALALISGIVDRCCYKVDAAALSRALDFAAYLETHALRVFAGGQEAEAKAAKEIVKHIRKGDLSDGFTCRDVHQHGWSHLTDNETVQSALDLLVNNDWLAEQQVRTAGRPKMTYLINPAVSENLRL